MFSFGIETCLGLGQFRVLNIYLCTKYVDQMFDSLMFTESLNNAFQFTEW